VNLTRRLLIYLSCFVGMIGSFTLPVESCNDRPWGLFLVCVVCALVTPFSAPRRRAIIYVWDKTSPPSVAYDVEVEE